MPQWWPDVGAHELILRSHPCTFLAPFFQISPCEPEVLISLMAALITSSKLLFVFLFFLGREEWFVPAKRWQGAVAEGSLGLLAEHPLDRECGRALVCRPGPSVQGGLSFGAISALTWEPRAAPAPRPGSLPPSLLCSFLCLQWQPAFAQVHLDPFNLSLCVVELRWGRRMARIYEQCWSSIHTRAGGCGVGGLRATGAGGPAANAGIWGAVGICQRV